jgi:hypothetical protein
MAEPTQAPRTPRDWKRVFARWLSGFVTDPHTKLTSAARIVGVMVAFALCAYVLVCAWTKEKPDPWVCSTLSGLVCAALALRAKSTQDGTIAPAMRRSDLQPPAAPEAPHG